MNPVKLRRLTLDMSIVKVASLCGWSKSTQSDIETGKVKLSESQMEKLSKALKLDFSNFVRK